MSDNPREKPGQRDERETLEKAVNDLEDRDGQRPEALRQLAESGRRGEDSPKELVAEGRTKPRPAANRKKHEVASRLLHEGAEGERPDPAVEGVDQLPDRITDRG